MQGAERNLHFLENQYKDKVANAKAHLGLMSEQGTEETRSLFWENFGWGKAIAKRSTMYDAIFGSIRAMGRNEGLFEFLFRMLLQLCINFTIGLSAALISFVWTLWSVIQTYKPDVFTALLFFTAATLGAYVLGLFWIFVVFVICVCVCAYVYII